MKKIVLLCGALLTLTAVAANAQLHLGVGDCGGPTVATWACTANTGNAVVVVASVTAPSAPPIQTLTGEASSVEIAFANPVPLWWQTGAGKCRLATAIAVSYSTALGGGSCMDYWGAVGTGPAGGSYMFIGPTTDAADGDVAANEVRVRTISAVDGISAADPGTVQPAPGDELFLFTLTVNRTKSTGTGFCAGCTEPACMVFTKCLLTQPVGVGDYTYATSLLNSDGSYLALQGGLPTCPNATPARSSSWGQVKSLYR